MVEAAYTHSKEDTSIPRFYHSLAQRKGKQALKSRPQELLLCCYSVLKNRRPYSDSGILMPAILCVSGTRDSDWAAWCE